MPRLGPYRWLIALIVAALALAAPSLSSAAADTRPPTAPTALAAVPATYGATLTWAASRDNVGVKYYLVTVAGQIKRPTTPKAWIGSLTPNTAYTATVRAVDAAGNKSSAASVSFRTLVIPPDTTPPSTPGALTATATATSATLSWAPATDNVAVTGYVVAAAGRSFTVTGTSALVTPLAPDT
ncbi:MAG: fibronectin type III domain-containing protein, partial [Nostocoides sp.]